MSRSIRRCGLLWILITISQTSPVAAQPKPTANARLAVDVVSLKSGRHLRGAIVWRQPNGTTTMAVSTKWLKESNSKLATTTLAENLEQQKLAWSRTADRINDQLKTVDDAPGLTFFLKQELARLKQLIAKPPEDEPKFVWVDLPPETISKLTPVSPEQRAIAMHGWHEGLNQVESRDATSLAKELKDKGVKLNGPAPDLCDQLPARLQSDLEWTARMAVVEYAVLKPIDFQGMGDTVIRTGDGQPIDLAKILPKLIDQQLGSLLKELNLDGRPPAKTAGNNDWLKSASREAETAKSTGFRVTRLEMAAGNGRVTVETHFVAQLAPGRWETVWQNSVNEDATKPRPQAEQQIEADPQLKPALETLKTIGLVDANVFKQAIRTGAATMAAQNTADGLFSEFRDRYSRRLDGPPLPVSASPTNK